MFGAGMIGEKGPPRYDGEVEMNHTFWLEKDQLLPWLETLHIEYRLVGPVLEDGYPVFKPALPGELVLDYGLTMMGPQTFLYHLTENLCSLFREDGRFVVKTLEEVPPQLLVGVHSCDLHGILALDKAFLEGPVVDRNYRLWRKNTLVVGYHCTRIYPQCFCASMGTGPFFEPQKGCDFLLTDLGDGYIMESFGERADRIPSPHQVKPASPANLKRKDNLRRELLGRFKKELDTTHLVDTLLNNQDHAVWKRTAEERCLGCANCTMVCPTCFCYGVKDRSVGLDPHRWERTRQKDSCQDLHFAEVHGANFRSTRMARLRQFVTHKLATWREQFGSFGCVGCGRCMTWCPTHIDLTEMAKEIMATT
jgi:sulfhydrogenase subunit beta (sulfur reductase)